MMDRTYLGSSYAELPTPALMDAGFRCHEAIAAMSIVYAGPGPVSDAKRAAKAIERHRDVIFALIDTSRRQPLIPAEAEVKIRYVDQPHSQI